MIWILLLPFFFALSFGLLYLDERGQRFRLTSDNTKLTTERDASLAELEKQKAAINAFLLKPVQISLSDLQLELVAYHVAEKMKEVDKRLVN